MVLGSTRLSIPNGISIGLAVFEWFTAQRPYTLQWAAAFHNIAPSYGATGPIFYTRLLGPTRVLNPNGISIGEAIFAGLTTTTYIEII